MGDKGISRIGKRGPVINVVLSLRLQWPKGGSRGDFAKYLQSHHNNQQAFIFFKVYFKSIENGAFLHLKHTIPISSFFFLESS